MTLEFCFDIMMYVMMYVSKLCKINYDINNKYVKLKCQLYNLCTIVI